MKRKFKPTTSPLLLAALFSLSATPLVQAQDDDNTSGLFISGAYGAYKAHGGEFDDEEDLLAASVGYQFNSYLALEADYVDFGNFGEDDVEADLKGLGLALRGRLPLTDTFGIYARAGAFASAFDVEAFDEDETYDDLSPFVGAGVDFQITERLTAFGQYDRYNVDVDEDDFNGQIDNDGPDFDTVRAGVQFMF